MEEKEIISVKNISKSFGGREILKHLTFTVKKRKVTLYLGENGAGKTTTIRTLLFFLNPENGKINISEPKIGYIQQIPDFFLFLSGEEILQKTAEVFKIKNYKEKVISISNELDFNLDLLKRTTNKFSPGEKKKLAYIQALITEPNLLIVDEPFSSLDPFGIKSIKRILNKFIEKGKTVFVSSHLLSETEKLADDIIIIHQGKIILQTEWGRKKGLEEFFFTNIKKKHGLTTL